MRKEGADNCEEGEGQQWDRKGCGERAKLKECRGSMVEKEKLKKVGIRVLRIKGAGGKEFFRTNGRGKGYGGGCEVRGMIAERKRVGGLRRRDNDR